MKEETTYKIASFILLIMLLAILWKNIDLIQQNDDIETGKALVSYWACDEGCFYAMCDDFVTFEGNKNIVKTCSEEEFNKCAKKCFDKFMMPEIKK